MCFREEQAGALPQAEGETRGEWAASRVPYCPGTRPAPTDRAAPSRFADQRTDGDSQEMM